MRKQRQHLYILVLLFGGLETATPLSVAVSKDADSRNEDFQSSV